MSLLLRRTSTDGASPAKDDAAAPLSSSAASTSRIDFAFAQFIRLPVFIHRRLPKNARFHFFITIALLLLALEDLAQCVLNFILRKLFLLGLTRFVVFFLLVLLILVFVVLLFLIFLFLVLFFLIFFLLILLVLIFLIFLVLLLLVFIFRLRFHDLFENPARLLGIRICGIHFFVAQRLQSLVHFLDGLRRKLNGLLQAFLDLLRIRRCAFLGVRVLRIGRRRRQLRRLLCN